MLAAALVLAACTGNDAERSEAQGDGSAPPAAREAALGGLRFTEVAAEAGIDGPASDLELVGEAAMSSGAAVADVDGDGDLDIFLPRIGKPNALYLNDGRGSFTDQARRAGLAGASQRFGSAAAAFLDLEGDGDLDLFVAGSGQGGNDLFVNDGNGVLHRAVGGARSELAGGERRRAGLAAPRRVGRGCRW